MELESGWYIDAREKGGLSRFINHSCDPNCQLQRTNVAGDMRIAIVAIKPVLKGDFLCYDYQFDTKHASKFKCACGAPRCRGTMKGGKEYEWKEEEKNKSKSQLLKEARAKEDKERAFVEKVQQEQIVRLNQTGFYVPESGGNDETILTGPLDKLKGFTMDNRIALWRNVLKGYAGLMVKMKENL